MKAFKSLEKRGWIHIEDLQAERDPLRASAERLRVESRGFPGGVKLKKVERELLSYLDLHPGSHNLKELDKTIAGAGEAARSLGRRNLLNITTEQPTGFAPSMTSPPVLNESQRAALRQVETGISAKEFRAFLLHGVTGSGKT